MYDDAICATLRMIELIKNGLVVKGKPRFSVYLRVRDEVQ